MPPSVKVQVLNPRHLRPEMTANDLLGEEAARVAGGNKTESVS
jgi:hypothetical protein